MYKTVCKFEVPFLI